VEKSANPAPLGLMGFGMTTVLLNIHNAGYFPLSPVILSTGIFYGGLAQIIAGILEYKKGNTFGLTAFVSYGMFWLMLVALILSPKLGLPEATPVGFMGCFFALWGLFTFFMFLGTLKSSGALQLIFFLLAVLFGLLAARDFTGSQEIGIYAGFEGIACGACAIYLAVAEVVNEQIGRTILPIGAPAPANPERKKPVVPAASAAPAAQTTPGPTTP
jgi:succinate-acetate transporter protein